MGDNHIHHVVTLFALGRGCPFLSPNSWTGKAESADLESGLCSAGQWPWESFSSPVKRCLCELQGVCKFLTYTPMFNGSLYAPTYQHWSRISGQRVKKQTRPLPWRGLNTDGVGVGETTAQQPSAEWGGGAPMYVEWWQGFFGK